MYKVDLNKIDLKAQTALKRNQRRASDIDCSKIRMSTERKEQSKVPNKRTIYNQSLSISSPNNVFSRLIQDSKIRVMIKEYHKQHDHDRSRFSVSVNQHNSRIHSRVHSRNSFTSRTISRKPTNFDIESNNDFGFEERSYLSTKRSSFSNFSPVQTKDKFTKENFSTVKERESVTNREFTDSRQEILQELDDLLLNKKVHTIPTFIKQRSIQNAPNIEHLYNKYRFTDNLTDTKQ